MVSRVEQIVRSHVGEVGGTISALRAIMVEAGYLDARTLTLVAREFNISQAEVKGIVDFYTDFSTTPPARFRIKVCQAEACQAVGARGLADDLCRQLGVQMQGSSADGNYSIEPVYCLGLCANGPAAMVNDRLIARAESSSVLDDAQ